MRSSLLIFKSILTGLLLSMLHSQASQIILEVMLRIMLQNNLRRSREFEVNSVLQVQGTTVLINTFD